MKALEARRIRRALGLSQEQMAKLMGLSERQVRRFESGEQPIPKATAMAYQSLLLNKKA